MVGLVGFCFFSSGFRAHPQLRLERSDLWVHAAYNQGSLIILSVYAPSKTLPLRQGDRIARADGQSISSSLDWFVVLSNLRVGKPVNFEIQRGEQSLQLSVTPGPRWSVGFFHPGTLLLLRIGQMMMLGVARFVAFVRPRSPTALLAALFFAGLSLFNVPESISGYAAWFHDLPRLIVGLLRIPEVASTLTPLSLFFLKDAEVRSYCSEPDRGRRNWKGKQEETAAVYQNRRRIRGERGKRLLRQRGERVEEGRDSGVSENWAATRPSYRLTRSVRGHRRFSRYG